MDLFDKFIEKYGSSRPLLHGGLGSVAGGPVGAGYGIATGTLEDRLLLISSVVNDDIMTDAEKVKSVKKVLKSVRSTRKRKLVNS